MDSETAAILEKFTANFEKELDDKLPGTVGRALGGLLAPIHAKQTTQRSSSMATLTGSTKRRRARHFEWTHVWTSSWRRCRRCLRALAQWGQAAKGAWPVSPPRKPRAAVSRQPAHIQNAPGSASATATASGTSTGERLVLMKLSCRKLRSVREGVERAARSRLGYQGPVPTYSGTHFHTHLTLHFETCDDAERYSQTFRNAGIKDDTGGDVIYSHKDRVDNRSPQVKSRGAAKRPLYAEVKAALRQGKMLEQVHDGKDGARFTLFCSVNESTDAVRDLVEAHWTDDVATVQITSLTGWHSGVESETRAKAAKAAGM